MKKLKSLSGRLRLVMTGSQRPDAALGLVVVALVVVISGYVITRYSRAATVVGDINNDGVVNVLDLSLILSHWNTTNYAAGDLNTDGTVNVFDLSMLLNHWGQSGTSTPTPTPTPTPSGSPTGYACNLSYTNNRPDDWNSDPNGNNSQGKCPSANTQYADIPNIVTGDPNYGAYLNQNVWGAPPPNYVQSMHANSPRDWYVTINEASDNPSDPNANGGVHQYPNLGFWMNGPVDSYTSITSSWNVTIPQTNTVAGWAAYDLWFNDDGTEVMIQADIGADSYYNCNNVATATFSGQPWHMCVFGNERVWKRGTDDNHLVNNVSSGTVDIKQILTWMESHTFVDSSSGTPVTRQQLAPNSVWYTHAQYVGASFGFEVPSTSGQNQDFRVNDFSWTATK